jgi:hypothetical protein
MNGMNSSFLGESPLQNFLRAGYNEPLKYLEEEIGIKCKRHPRFPNLVLFVYDQIESPKTHFIVRSARGHILDEDNNWEHVCRPFDRFLNWGEAVEAGALTPDLSNSVVFKKEDGSLLNMWFYRDEWHVSTKGSPDAGGQVGDNPFTFAELFWRVWNDKGLFVPPVTEEQFTFCFELCTLHNRVVCSQPEERIVLLGARVNDNGREVEPEEWEDDGLEVCKSYDLGNIDDVESTFKELPALEMEGYVVAQFLPDGRVIRTKVKHPGYLAIHHLKEGNSKKRLLELVRTGEEGEFLSYFPEYGPQFDEIRGKFEGLVSELEAAWEVNHGIENQKDFALQVKDIRMSGVIFGVRKMGGSIRGRLADVPIDNLALAIGLKGSNENEAR